MKKQMILAGIVAVGLAGLIGGTLIEGTHANATTMVKQEQPERQFGIYFYFVDEQGKEISEDDCVTLVEGDSYDLHRDIREIKGYKYLGLFDEAGNEVTENLQGQANENLKYYYRYRKLREVTLDFYYVDEEGKEVRASDFATVTEGDYFDTKSMEKELPDYKCIGFKEGGRWMIAEKTKVVEDKKYYFIYQRRCRINFIYRYWVGDHCSILRSNYILIDKGYGYDIPIQPIDFGSNYQYIGLFDDPDYHGNKLNSIQGTANGDMYYYYEYHNKYSVGWWDSLH